MTVSSKGNKISYSCPNCRQNRISKIVFHGQVSGHCIQCNTVWPWRTRIKESLKNIKKGEKQNESKSLYCFLS